MYLGQIGTRLQEGVPNVSTNYCQTGVSCGDYDDKSSLIIGGWDIVLECHAVGLDHGSCHQLLLDSIDDEGDVLVVDGRLRENEAGLKMH